MLPSLGYQHSIFFYHAVAFLHAPGFVYKLVQLLFYHSYATWLRRLRFNHASKPTDTVATSLSCVLLCSIVAGAILLWGASVRRLWLVSRDLGGWCNVHWQHPQHMFCLRLMIGMGSVSVQWAIDAMWLYNIYELPAVGKTFYTPLWLFPASWTMAHIFQGGAAFVAWAEAMRLEETRDGSICRVERYRAAEEIRWMLRGEGGRNLDSVIRRIFRNYTFLSFAWMFWFFGARKLFYSFPVLVLMCLFCWRQAYQLGRIHWLAAVLYMPSQMWSSYAVYAHFELIRLNEFK